MEGLSEISKGGDKGCSIVERGRVPSDRWKDE